VGQLMIATSGWMYEHFRGVFRIHGGHHRVRPGYALQNARQLTELPQGRKGGTGAGASGGRGKEKVH
jgi:hypothetical protein